MIKENLKCRLVRHTLPDGESHLDIFIPRLDYGQTSHGLICLEAHRSLEVQLSREISLQIQPRSLKPSEPDWFFVSRKKDHRNVYWDYEGPISNHRGMIRHLGYYPVEVDRRALLQQENGEFVLGLFRKGSVDGAI